MSNITRHLKEDGLHRTIVHYIRHWLGINMMSEEISSLYYLFDHYIDITTLPTTKDSDLRLLQQCDTMLLGIFDKLCTKYSLTYWIDYGTLIGAIRHKGFIPWDDDTDLSMPREDYNKVIPLMKDELLEYGIDIYYMNDQPLKSIGMAYKHSETGIWIDIFPDDHYMSEQELSVVRDQLSPLMIKYRKYYHKFCKSKSVDSLWEKKKELLFDKQDGSISYLFTGQEFPLGIRVMPESDLIPTIRVPFENITLSAPNKSDDYLKYVYGDGYMSYPHSGLEHHGGKGKGRPALKHWASMHSINMQDVYIYLNSVYESV